MREYYHHLLTTELGAVLISESDQPAQQQPWAQPINNTEEEEDMGLFDELREAGVKLEEIPTDPFKYDDGPYIVAFVSAVVNEPAQDDWDYVLELSYQFVDGKYKGKPLREQKRIPTAANFAKDEEGATRSLTQTFQRLAQIGVEDPQNADIQKVNEEFRGKRYELTLNTPIKNNPNQRQYIQGLRLQKSDATSVDDLFKE